MSDVNDSTLAEMDPLVAEGVTDFKLFTAYPGRLLLRRRRHLPGHAADRPERRPDPDARRERHGHRRRRRPGGRRRARPTPTTTASCATPSSRARRPTGSSAWPRRPTCRSTSSTSRRQDALDALREARDRGARAYAETCPQYLFLSLEDMGNGFEGAKYVCSPPLRPADHQVELWKGIIKDDLQVVSTDHCPFDFHDQKQLGQGDFRKVPNGLPGVEDRLDLMHDGGVVAGGISKERWVEICSAAPARMFGLAGRKGVVAVGADADLVVYDPARAAHHLRIDPPHGRRLLLLRGPDRDGRLRRRAVARQGRRRGRRLHGHQGRRPLPQARRSHATTWSSPSAADGAAAPLPVGCEGHRPHRHHVGHSSGTRGWIRTIRVPIGGSERGPPPTSTRGVPVTSVEP